MGRFWGVCVSDALTYTFEENVLITGAACTASHDDELAKRKTQVDVIVGSGRFPLCTLCPALGVSRSPLNIMMAKGETVTFAVINHFNGPGLTPIGITGHVLEDSPTK